MRSMEFHLCPVGFKKEGEVRPVVVLFGWLLAKSRHLHKYGELYHQYGADVITVKLEVMEVGAKIFTDVGSSIEVKVGVTLDNYSCILSLKGIQPFARQVTGTMLHCAMNLATCLATDPQRAHENHLPSVLIG